MTRRELLCGLMAARFGFSKPRTPSICVASGALTGVGYSEIGEIVKQLGFDGIEVALMRGGLVEPHLAPVDEVRAFESIHGAGLETPIIALGWNPIYDPWTRTVLALAGRTGVSLFRTALPANRNDAAGLVALAREYKLGMTFPVGTGAHDCDVPFARNALENLDPKWAGVSLQSSCFLSQTGFSDAQLHSVQPLVKAVTVNDFRSDGTDAPLGQGSVDFGRMFGLLARASFTGPITVERSYKTVDEPDALRRDAEFVRKQIQAAYVSVKT